MSYDERGTQQTFGSGLFMFLGTVALAFLYAGLAHRAIINQDSFGVLGAFGILLIGAAFYGISLFGLIWLTIRLFHKG